MEYHDLGATTLQCRELGKRAIARARDALARMFIGFANIDEDSALVDQKLGLLGVYGWQGHGSSFQWQ
jgi:hypothetical protein